MARKRRGPPPPPLPWDSLYPTLDLHGASAEEARRRTLRWLDEQWAAGVRTVRVITGKGLHSVGPPVLRNEIEALLRSLRGTRIAHYTGEPGGGAFRIELRPPRGRPAAGRTPARPRPPGASADPGLRRRAEEALWELGVRPTPELIEAEVRRLLQENVGEGG